MERYADVKVRVELRTGKTPNQLPLLGERAGVRGEFTATPMPNGGAPLKKKPRKIAAKRKE
ncbi:hypothetical protein BR1R3_51450 [Pseudomonas atacamensis]|nr:hypothetical protein BR1R3_51450 [Pseudomonas atacamensis]